MKIKWHNCPDSAPVPEEKSAKSRRVGLDVSADVWDQISSSDLLSDERGLVSVHTFWEEDRAPASSSDRDDAQKTSKG
jgi:hypothetical protein